MVTIFHTRWGPGVLHNNTTITHTHTHTHTHKLFQTDIQA